MNRRYLLFGLGVLVTAVSLYFAFRNTGFVELVRNLREARFELVPVVVAALGGFYALKALRWRRLLEKNGEGPGARALFGPMTIGFACNNLLPFRMGEIVRVIIGAKRTELPHMTIFSSVVAERVLDVIALFALTAIAAAAGTSAAGMSHPLIPWILPGAIALTAGLLILVFALDRIEPALRQRALAGNSPRLAGLASKVTTFHDGIENLRSPREFLLLLGNSLVQWLLLAAAILVSCYAVGVEIRPDIAIYLLLLLTFAISVPSAPGFVGIVELAFVVGLGSFGIDEGDALAAAVYYHIIAWVSVTAVGTWYLHRYSLSWASVAPDASVASTAK